jgi:mono/diheme cytochrome c family protein
MNTESGSAFERGRKGVGRHAMAAALVLALELGVRGGAAAPTDTVDFNRDVRRVLSENCFKCHGPDSKVKADGKQGLRLDLAESALATRGGHAAVVPGHPEKSELIRRITTNDSDDQMPPPDSGKQLTAKDVAVLKRWIEQGATYSRHWSYMKPVRPALPMVRTATWPKNGIDSFILARLEKETLQPAVEADRLALIRRVSLDLTGLPPTLAEVDEVMADKDPGAYERYVERLFKKDSFGEHWARLWLDQARYADSSGYADDPARTIWAYRDYVIRSFNANKPFDQFTVEQLAGDLLPEPTDEQLVATAFHRNTMTNNEGGTNDEEYRNVAIVDRVNTTMAVWMGTTINCAQCHNHKYDPITQEEYFQLYAVLNNTADADRGDESPILPLYTTEQKLQRKQWQMGVSRLEKLLQTPTSELDQEQAVWEKRLETPIVWQNWNPIHVVSDAGAAIKTSESGVVQVARGGKTDTYRIELPVVTNETVTAIRLEALPQETSPGGGVGHAGGNFVVTRVTGTLIPPQGSQIVGRYVRIELPGKQRILSLAEVQAFQGTNNVARGGEAKQSSTAFNGPAKLAIDGNTNGDFNGAKSTTHTETTDDPWWEVDLKSSQTVDRVVVWNRTDGVEDRLNGFKISLLGERREILWERVVGQIPKPSLETPVDGTRPIPISVAVANYAEKGFEAGVVVDNKDPQNRGWAIGPKYGERHTLDLFPLAPLELRSGSKLVVTIEQQSKYEFATVAQFRLAKSSDPRADELARIPAMPLSILRTPAASRTEAQRGELQRYFLTTAPSLQPNRDQLAQLKKRLNESKPYTTVPVLRELAVDQRRKTQLQKRGNWLELGKELHEGLPSAFHRPQEELPVDRLGFAQWLVSPENPLTARVVVNRFWESIFGVGLVRTSEEFGAQGELPSHPELLDWLAVELMEKGWDVNHILRLMVTSAAYRQSSKVTPEQAAQDPENRLLARGPRFRLSAEMIRDQALFLGGLLSSKMYGPPVKPPQPKLGLSAAFGSGTDWDTSSGEDRYRRGIYTTWRRSNPYPSMATFDAPNREVCLVRRERSNTPLQALVTLNDPVYMEAAQALARRMASHGSAALDRSRYGFRLCLSRSPSDDELSRLVNVYSKALERYRADPEKARLVATKPLGDLPAGSDVAEMAALTVVGNVLLNLDELLMKR